MYHTLLYTYLEPWRLSRFLCAPLVLDSYFIGDRSVGRACGATASSIDYDVIDSPGALFISSPPSLRILVLSRAYVCFKFYSARPVAPVLLGSCRQSFILCCESEAR